MVADAEAIENEGAFSPVLMEERRRFRGSFAGNERDQLFYNPDSSLGTFVTSAYVFGLDNDHDGRAVASVDIDGDGDLDLALLTLQGLRLLENPLGELSEHPPRYSRVRLTATKSQQHALGAVVTLIADDVEHRDYVKITEGFQTQVPLDLHFGLGDADEITELVVEWPSGHTDIWTDLPVDRLLQVEEGSPDVTAEPLSRWSDGTRPRVIGSPSRTVEAPLLDGGVAQLWRRLRSP